MLWGDMPLHSNPDNTVTFDSLVSFLSSISERAGLNIAITEVLLEQMEGLRVLYGEKIPKEDALRIIAKQIEVTKTGYIRDPVDIVEFVESPEYMNQGAYVRPRILDSLIKLHGEGRVYKEVVLGGGIGIGKNYFTDLSLGYDLYRLSCLYSPHAYYELAIGSKIVFVHQSKTEKLAKEVVFDHFGARLAASGYFPQYFPHDPTHKKSMKFPHMIEVLPISSADTSALGMNVFGAVIDEMNFMSKIKKSKKRTHTENQEYDQAEALYTSIIRRIESRYNLIGKIPGKIYLISSANYQDDFIDRKEKEAEHDPNIFVMHMSQWESFMNKDGTLMKKRYSGKMFFVRKPSENASGAIYDDYPEDATEEDIKHILEVPIEHKKAFDRDMIGSLRDIAGVAVTKTSRFLERNYIMLAYGKYRGIYGDRQIFKENSVELYPNSVYTDFLDFDFLRRLSPYGPFAVHIDLAVSGDAAGVAIGHAIGSKDVGNRMVFDSTKGVFVSESKGSLPIYGIPGIIQVVPPKNGEIELNVLRNLVGTISDYIPIYYLTMDRYQSATFLQYFRGRQVASSILSMDRSPEPYMETKFAIKEQRVFLANNPVVADEMPNLDQDTVTGKIDHPEGETKDVSDAIAGVVYTLSNKRSSYRMKYAPKILPAAAPIPKKLSRRESRRPSSGREPMYG